MIHNIFLRNVAEDIRVNNTFYLAYSSDTAFTVDPSSTVLPGEVGSRVLCGVTNEEGNDIILDAVRLSTDVVNHHPGDRLWGLGLFNAAVGGDLLHSYYIPGLLHTTSFDFGMNITLEVNRR